MLIMAAVIIRVMILTTMKDGVFSPKYLDDGGCVSAHVMMKEYLENFIEFTKIFIGLLDQTGAAVVCNQKRGFHFPHLKSTLIM